MSKNVKLFLGVVINIITGIAGLIIWFFSQDSVKMKLELKDYASITFAVAFIPALILFLVWFFKCVKANKQIGGVRPAIWVYFLAGLAATWLIPVICSVVFFPKAILYGVIAAAIASVGSFIAYKVSEPTGV